MKVEIALFGITKEIVGSSKIDYEVSDRQSVSGLLAQLYKDYPKLKELKSLFVAINSDYADNEQLLNEKDEIALIPPVSGG